MPRRKKPRSKRRPILPDEIVFQIVERLPVKSLPRSRCVCKSWNSYITSPTFISSFISKRYLKNHDDEDDDDFILHMPSSRLSISRFSSKKVCTVSSSDRTFEKISDIGFPSFISGFAVLVGSCNGLLCLADYKNEYLWNLSIRKFKRLPYTNLNIPGVLRVVGFGYDSQNNDYKVVKITCSQSRPVIEVYTLSLDSWKIVELGISGRPNVAGYKFCKDRPCPLVSGHLHWIVCIKQGGGRQAGGDFKMILSFDVNSEKFKELPMPGDDWGILSLTSFKGKLALTVMGESCGLPICIWVMREYGVPESWSKLFVVSFENTLNEILAHFIGFTKNGSVLIQKKYRKKKKKKRSGWREKCVLIDPETLHEKYTTIKAEDCIIMVSYTENLALLDTANVESY